MSLTLRMLALCAGGLSLSALGGEPAAAQIHAAFQAANADGNAVLDRKVDDNVEDGGRQVRVFVAVEVRRSEARL